MSTPTYRLEGATTADLEELVRLRIEAMRESLARLGRFDPVRARERLAEGFVPSCTRFIVTSRGRVGFLVVKPQPDALLLDHLYLIPSAQGGGIGGAVLREVLDEAERRGLGVTVCALRGSAANRFYLRYGFLPTGEGEWDVYYRWQPRASPTYRPTC